MFSSLSKIFAKFLKHLHKHFQAPVVTSCYSDLFTIGLVYFFFFCRDKTLTSHAHACPTDVPDTGYGVRELGLIYPIKYTTNTNTIMLNLPVRSHIRNSLSLLHPEPLVYWPISSLLTDAELKKMKKKIDGLKTYP